MTKFIILDVFLFLLFITLIVVAVWVIIDIFFTKEKRGGEEDESNQSIKSSK